MPQISKFWILLFYYTSIWVTTRHEWLGSALFVLYTNCFLTSRITIWLVSFLSSHYTCSCSSRSIPHTLMRMFPISLCTKSRLMKRCCLLCIFETIWRTRSLSNSLTTMVRKHTGLHMYMALLWGSKLLSTFKIAGLWWSWMMSHTNIIKNERSELNIFLFSFLIFIFFSIYFPLFYF